MTIRKKIGLWLISIGLIMFIVGVSVFSCVGDCPEILKIIGEISFVSWWFVLLLGGLLYKGNANKKQLL